MAILGLAAAVLGPAPDLFRSRTEPSSLDIKSIGNSGVTQFVLPVDAPLEEMPYEESPGCSEPALEWLKRFGVERPPSYMMTVRNKAVDGPILSIKNVRVVDKQKFDPKPVIVIDCPSAGLGDTAVLNLHLDKEGPALLVDQETNQKRPFAFNLEPGEEGSIDLRLLADFDGYSGRVVADVSSGDETRHVELVLDDGSGRFNRAGLGKAAQLLVSPASRQGLFYCSESDVRGQELRSGECTPADARARIRELWSETAPLRFPKGQLVFELALEGARKLLAYQVENDRGLPHAELAYVDGPTVIDVLADELSADEMKPERPQGAKCGPAEEFPMSCVVTFSVGAHGSAAIVVELTDKAITVTDRDSVGVGTPTAETVDLSGDGIPDLAAQGWVGVYAEGFRYWITWENRDGRLIQTGCSATLGPDEPHVVPIDLQRAPCPI